MNYLSLNCKCLCCCLLGYTFERCLRPWIKIVCKFELVRLLSLTWANIRTRGTMKSAAGAQTQQGCVRCGEMPQVDTDLFVYTLSSPPCPHPSDQSLSLPLSSTFNTACYLFPAVATWQSNTFCKHCCNPGEKKPAHKHCLFVMSGVRSEDSSWHSPHFPWGRRLEEDFSCLGGVGGHGGLWEGLILDWKQVNTFQITSPLVTEGHRVVCWFRCEEEHVI